MTKYFLTETKKALQIVERKLREFENGPDRKGRIELIKKLLPEAQSITEYEELKKEYDTLAFEEMKNFNQSPIPQDVKELILANHDIEMEVLKNVIHLKYGDLEKHIKTFEENVKPLLKELNALHACANSVQGLEHLLKRQYAQSIGGHFVNASYSVPRKTGILKNYSLELTKKVEELIKICGGKK